VVIENRDALELIRIHDSRETLFYVDPPYVKSTRIARVAYGHEMNDAGHRRLSNVLNSIQGMAVVSGYPCPLYEELYRDWHCITRKALADGGTYRVEALWLSPNLPERQMRLFA
jgi:DNA adenine methylase